MFEFLSNIFNTSDFMPRWECGNWSPGHGWLHIASDIGTWGAYTAIPFVLAYFVLRRRDVVFPRIFWLFGCFILFCGLVHLVEATIFWWPWYRFSGVVKLATALVSWTTVVALVHILPKALSLPGLQGVNLRLEKEVEERTRAEQRFRLVFEASPNAIIVIDRDGEIVLVNSNLEELFGYQRDELIGMPVETLVPDRFRKQHVKHRNTFFSAPESRPMGVGRELFGLRKDGSEFPVEIGLNPSQMDGRQVVLGSILDITQRKRSEAALQQANDELQHKNEEMEQFVYTVSHDLKAPLVTTMGFVGALKEDVADNNAEGVLDAAGRIEGAAHHMSELIEDLLQLSRIGRGRHTVTEVDASTVIQGVVERFAPQAEQAGATIKVQPGMTYVLADPMRLNQLFENLLSNALKYGCGHPNPEIRIGWQREPNEVRFYVQDNGPGIPPEYHAKVFGLFQRLETRQEGTGVGLAIVVRIAQSHGGRVWVESEPGAGATFWVAWPTI